MDSFKLSDVCRIVRGERITKTQLDPNGTYDVWSGGVTPMGKFGRYNREPNVTTVAQYGSAGYVEWHDKKFWANDVCYTLYPCDSVISKYLYYAVKNQEELLYRLRTDAVPACLPLDVLQSISIPVPPLHVQEEIVRILDKFTELEAELAQELARRKQQYAFYRDQLLNFDEYTISVLPLLRVASVLYGYPCDATKFNNDKAGRPLVRIRDVLDGNTQTYTTEDVPTDYTIKKGDLLIGMDGNFHVGSWKSEDAILCQRVCCIKSSDETVVLNRYLHHFLPSVIKHIENNKPSGTVKHLLAKDIQAITIPVPDLAVQKRLVHVLDNFDSICSDLSIGLPAEISARQKQYEYYRDFLFEYAANGLNFSRAQQSTAEHKLIAYVFGPKRCA